MSFGRASNSFFDRTFLLFHSYHRLKNCLNKHWKPVKHCYETTLQSILTQRKKSFIVSPLKVLQNYSSFSTVDFRPHQRMFDYWFTSKFGFMVMPTGLHEVPKNSCNRYTAPSLESLACQTSLQCQKTKRRAVCNARSWGEQYRFQYSYRMRFKWLCVCRHERCHMVSLIISFR